METMNYNYVCRNEDGSVSVDDSVEAYREALERWVEVNESSLERIRDGVNSVLALAALSESPRVASPTLVGLVMTRLQAADAVEYNTLSKKVEGYLKENLGGEDSDCKYCSTAGKGGGVTFTKAERVNRGLEEAEEVDLEETNLDEVDLDS